MRNGVKIYVTHLGLVDTGSSSLLMDMTIAREIGGTKLNAGETKWNTQEGQFKTQRSRNVIIVL